MSHKGVFFFFCAVRAGITESLTKQQCHIATFIQRGEDLFDASVPVGLTPDNCAALFESNRDEVNVSPALAGRPFRRCLSTVALLVSHSRICKRVDVDHDYKFDMFATRKFISQTNTLSNKCLCRNKLGNRVKVSKVT